MSDHPMRARACASSRKMNDTGQARTVGGAA